MLRKLSSITSIHLPLSQPLHAMYFEVIEFAIHKSKLDYQIKLLVKQEGRDTLTEGQIVSDKKKVKRSKFH